MFILEAHASGHKLGWPLMLESHLPFSAHWPQLGGSMTFVPTAGPLTVSPLPPAESWEREEVRRPCVMSPGFPR